MGCDRRPEGPRWLMGWGVFDGLGLGYSVLGQIKSTNYCCIGGFGDEVGGKIHRCCTRSAGRLGVRLGGTTHSRAGSSTVASGVGCDRPWEGRWWLVGWRVFDGRRTWVEQVYSDQKHQLFVAFRIQYVWLIVFFVFRQHTPTQTR